MYPLKRVLVPLGILLLVAGAALAAFWQPLAARFAPAPVSEKLTIAISPAYIGSGLLHIATAKGYLAAEGLEVTLQPHTSGSSALNAVVGNRAEVATVGDTPLMFMLTRKVPLAIVATIASATHSHGIVARRDRGISVSGELKGKTVGATLGTDAHFLLDVLLASNKIAPGDIQLKNLRPEEMAAQLAAGTVDAVATWDPWLSGASKAVGSGGITLFAEKGFSFGFHLVGQRAFVQQHPAAMKKLLRALLRAEGFLEQHPNEAHAIIVRAITKDLSEIDIVWSNFNLSLGLSQALMTMLEDQARWAIAGRYTDTLEVPKFLESIYADAMLAVKPEATSIVR